jgi:hypothetical protein
MKQTAQRQSLEGPPRCHCESNGLFEVNWSIDVQMKARLLKTKCCTYAVIKWGRCAERSADEHGLAPPYHVRSYAPWHLESPRWARCAPLHLFNTTPVKLSLTCNSHHLQTEAARASCLIIRAAGRASTEQRRTLHHHVHASTVARAHLRPGSQSLDAPAARSRARRQIVPRL